MLQIFHYLFL